MRFGACACCGSVLHASDALALNAAGDGTPDAFNVDPREAIDFLRNKLLLPTKTWTDIWQEAHSAAFVVAGAQSESLLTDFKTAVEKAIAQGTTLNEFRKDFDTIVATHGWSYNGSRGWRSRVIFQTNLRMAYAAGRWQQIQQVKATRPYLRYVAVMDARTRPLHRAWHDTVLPAEDDWWKTHFPPNGWNCRCTVQSLSARDVDRFGLTVADEAPPIVWRRVTVGSGDAERTVRVPEGIDPGFAYRPGTPPSEAIRAGLELRGLGA